MSVDKRILPAGALILAAASLLLAGGCASTAQLPGNVVEFATGVGGKAYIQLRVKTYASRYLTEVLILRDDKILERVGMIGTERRDTPEFFSHHLQQEINELTVAVEPGTTSFLLRSYDMAEPRAFQVRVAAPGSLTPVFIHKQAVERGYLFEVEKRRWKVEVRPAVPVVPR